VGGVTPTNQTKFHPQQAKKTELPWAYRSQATTTPTTTRTRPTTVAKININLEY